jgi:hypothetical protein
MNNEQWTLFDGSSLSNFIVDEELFMHSLLAS